MASSTSSSSLSPPTIILGAGVVGLSTAHRLLYPPSSSAATPDQHRPVLILSSSLPTDPISTVPADYASLWAGAHYRPIPASTPQLAYERTLALETHATMLQLADAYPESETGIARMPAEEYLEQLPDKATATLRSGDVYAGPNDGFHVLSPAELSTLNNSPSSKGQNPVKWACSYQTYCINVTLYLRFLLQRIQARDGRVVQTHVSSFPHAVNLACKLGFLPRHDSINPSATPPVVVLDATGRGLTPDPRVNVIRGQTLLVKQQYNKTITRQCSDSSWSFLIPRPGGGGTIVGGTKEIGDWGREVRAETREVLLARAKRCFPDFLGMGPWEVVRDNVGFRPWRDGGVRLQVEEGREVLVGDQGREKVNVRIVYGYGLGGRGYELSWGVAERLAELVDRGEVGVARRAKL